MDCRLLTGDWIDLSDYRFGAPQRSGSLTVVPITTSQTSSAFVPLSGGEVAIHRAGSGAAVLENVSKQDCVLAPLHFVLPIDRRDSHLQSRTTLIPPAVRLNLNKEVVSPFRSGRNVRLDAAAGYCLPLSMRGYAWRERTAFDSNRRQSLLNEVQGQMHRLGQGTLDLVLQARHSELNRLLRRIELLTGQSGALFFIDDRPVGLEIAPSPAYFAAIWQPLLAGCYGLTALLLESEKPAVSALPEPYAVSHVTELRSEMFRARHERQERLRAAVSGPSHANFTVVEEQRWGNYRVQSLTGSTFAGQYVEEITKTEAADEGASAIPKMLRGLYRKSAAPTEETTHRRVVYASLFAL